VNLLILCLLRPKKSKFELTSEVERLKEIEKDED
jgi:hypothetical protein